LKNRADREALWAASKSPCFPLKARVLDRLGEQKNRLKGDFLLALSEAKG